MGDSAGVDDTYVAAIQHGTVDLPEDAFVVGVVRRPMGWFHAQVDENIADLGPPEPLLQDITARQQALENDGVDEARAHNRAMEESNFEERYRAYLETSEAASQARDRLLQELADGRDVVLVCYENTEEKRCHRTTLKEWIERARASSTE